MTLEGEYYFQNLTKEEIDEVSRNPHDIGRRILQQSLSEAPKGCRRNPHDIGRRILLDYFYEAALSYQSQSS